MGLEHPDIATIQDADRRRVLLSAWLRATATGVVGVLLGVHLAKVGLDPAQIGAVIGAGLAGAALAGGTVAGWADRLGRRRAMAALALLGAGGCLVVSTATHPWLLAVAAFLGMLNGMGRERGAANILEQAILPTTSEGHGRTLAFAHYNFLQDAGGALGAALAGLPVLLAATLGTSALTSTRLAWGVPILALMVTALLCLGLSPHVEAPQAARSAPLSPEGRRVIRKISGLFFVDAFGGGLLTNALLAYFLYRRFGLSEGSLALLFFVSRGANALSNYGAAWLAKRIGLVNTMVFTHIPSSLFLVGAAFAPSFPIAAGCFLLRECLVEMDVPTRQSYLMGVVRPEERTKAAGATQLVRMAGWALAPVLAGLLMKHAALAAPLFLGAGLKILYDLMLFGAFRHLKPLEEREEAHA